LPLIDLEQVIDAKAWAKAWALLQAMPYRRSGGFEPSGSNLTFESRMGLPSYLPNVVVGLQTAISRFVAVANDNPKPFTWLADQNKSIVAVRRGYQVLDSIH
jgi:hypothetical protein